MGIKDREYWRDNAPSGDWSPDDQPAEAKRPWTPTRILAWVGMGVLVAAIVAVAAFKASQ